MIEIKGNGLVSKKKTARTQSQREKKMIEIIKNEESEYAIVTSRFACRAELFAASELQKYFLEIFNAYVPYYSDRVKRRGKEIHVGRNVRSDIKEYYSDLGEEGYVIKPLDGGDVLISGGGGRGTLYGVYAFLRTYGGLKKYTKDVEVFDKKQSLFMEETEIKEYPAFEYRDSYSRFSWDADFSVKNALNSCCAPIPEEKGGRVKFFNCHHSFFDLVPPDIYKEKHPEYYSFADGDDAGRQLCLTNRGVYEAARKTLIEWIKQNPDCNVFSVAQEDSLNGYCKCENCRRIDEKYGSPSGSIITFVNKLAESIESEYPNVLLHTFAYRYSRKAPKGLKAHKNVIVRLCNIECERGKSFEKLAAEGSESAKNFLKDIEEWSQVADRLYVWDYAVNYRHYMLPMLPLNAFAENIRYYKSHGVKGVLMEGNFSYGGDACMGDLKNYLFAKLLFDPSLDENEIIRDFIYGVFGKGAPQIEEYVKLCNKLISEAKATIYDEFAAGYYDENFVKKADELFKTALENETDEAIKKRIEREYLSVEYMKIIIEENDELRAALADKFFEKLKFFKITELVERTDLRDAIRWIKESRYDDKTSNWFGTYYIVK